jgi:hypothetical protein
MDERSSRDADNIQWELPAELPLPSFRARGESTSSSATGVILQNNPIEHDHGDESPSSIPWSPPQDPGVESLPPLHRQPAPGRAQTDNLVENHKYPADMMEQVLGGPLRHLSSAPALLMLSSGAGSKRRPSTTPMEEQRYLGKREASYYRSATPAESYVVEPDKEKPTELVQTDHDDEEFVTGVPLACLIIGLMFAVFLISIDRTIISTVRMMIPPRTCF